MSALLLDVLQGTSDDEDTCFKINKGYAVKYQNFKEKQELDKLKQKYSNGELVEEEDDSSSSESEDENGEALTSQIENDFLKTLSMIKKKDPKIYDEMSHFYHNEEEDSSNTESNKRGSDKKKPVFLKDYERKRLLEKGEKALISDSDSEDDDDNGSGNPSRQNSDLTYVEEQEQIKQSFKLSDDDSDSDDSFLKMRQKTVEEKEAEDMDYADWLKGEGKKLTDQEVTDLNALQRYWTDPDLDESETFLRNYILNKEYIDKDNEHIPTYEEIVGEHDDEEEEEEILNKQDTFEKKFNFRFEEPDPNFIKSYSRTIAESVRLQDDTRKQKRKEREERKKKEKDKKREEIKKLKNLKRKEIMQKIEKVKEITGNNKVGFLEKDFDDDFDPKKYDELMQKVYDDEYYHVETNEEEMEKPQFTDDEDFLEENWDEWEGREDNGESYEEDDDCDDNHGDGEFIMDVDFLPENNHIGKISGKMNDKNRKKMSAFGKAVERKKPIFQPDEKTFEEYFDEYYKLDYEDIIDDLPVRFKYREVIANDFGLTVDEILTAENKELNQWCSLKKAVKIRTDREETDDIKKFRKKGRNLQKKAQILTSLYATEDDKKDKDQDQDKNLETENISKGKEVEKDRKEIMKKSKPLRLTSKFGNFKSKWKTGKQKQVITRKKKIMKYFKGANKKFISKLSADRLAAYGLNQPTKKQKQRKS